MIACTVLETRVQGEIMHAVKKLFLLAAGFATLSLPGIGRASPFLIIGNDEKIVWDDEGKAVLSPPGKDSVVIVDVAKPEEPKIVANLPLENTVVGPPVNMAISPNGDIALVANSIDLVQDGSALKQVPDDRIWVIDMKANPPKLVATVKGGKQKQLLHGVHNFPRNPCLEHGAGDHAARGGRWLAPHLGSHSQQCDEWTMLCQPDRHQRSIAKGKA